MISRRTAAQGAAALALGASFSGNAHAKADKPRTFVLVHGAWHGGWCWKYVREYLQAKGHHVFTPTLTGLGERSHLASPEVTLNTHITDVSNLLIWEELEDVVLVGHSYGGPVITGVCDAHKDRIAHAIFLDAITIEDGTTVMRGGTKEAAEQAFGPLIDGFLAPPRQPVSFGVPDHMTEELAWLRRRVTPHLLGTWTQPISLKNGGTDELPRTFIFCTDKPPLSESQKARVKGFREDPTWNYEELPCGHDAMVILPIETAQIFERIARDV